MATSLEFTERMTGHFSLGAVTYHDGRAKGEQEDSPVTFVLTISFADIDAFKADAATKAPVTGHVQAPALSPGNMPVVDGVFQMMVHNPDQVNTYNMRYDLTFEAPGGERYRLQGHKILKNSSFLNTWPATSTLYVEVSRVADGDVIGRGIMIIKPVDFAKQLTTFKVDGATGFLGSTRAKARFGQAFMGRLTPLFAGDLDTVGRFSADRTGALRASRLPEPEQTWLGEGSNVWQQGPPGPDAYLQLTRFHGGDKGPLLLAAGYGMEAGSMATPTIDTTLTEYAYEHGYDVWLFDYRDSIALPSAKVQSTIDDIALIDWPAAVAEVRRVSGAESVQAMGHCVGAVSILMAQLAGLDGVRSIVCSQFTVHPHASKLNKVKNAVRLDKVMQMLRVKGIEPNKTPNFVNKLMDVSLVVVPYPRGERCNRPICRWLNSMYGLTHAHSQLNDATHETFDEAFGFGNLTGMRQLALMNRKGRAVDHTGADTYLVHPERMAVPTLFIQGERNYIFMPSGTARTIAWLGEHNDPSLYELMSLEDYAHLDGIVGRDSSRDVYPGMFDFLDRHQPA